MKKNLILITVLLVIGGTSACSRPATPLPAPPTITRAPSLTTAPFIPTTEPAFTGGLADPTLLPSATSTVRGEPKLFPFNYQVKDDGEGWNLATIRTAFENVGSTIVPEGLPPSGSPQKL